MHAGEETYRHGKKGEIRPRGAVLCESFAGVRDPRAGDLKLTAVHTGWALGMLEEHFVQEVRDDYVFFKTIERKSR